MGTDADRGMEAAGRMLKASNAFIMEYKTDTNENSTGGYSGLLIDDDGARLYSHSSSSKINAELVGGQDAYSNDGAAIPDTYL